MWSFGGRSKDVDECFSREGVLFFDMGLYGDEGYFTCNACVGQGRVGTIISMCRAGLGAMSSRWSGAGLEWMASFRSFRCGTCPLIERAGK